MRKLTGAICVLVLAGLIVFAQTGRRQEPVEIENMTYPEIYSAIHDHGKTTVLVYNGGTEQRGPHAVLGGHTLMAQAIAPMIARKLGNALVAPVLAQPKTTGVQIVMFLATQMVAMAWARAARNTGLPAQRLEQEFINLMRAGGGLESRG